MADEKPPAFQFYVNDFVGSGTVEAMSTEAVGAYVLLLCKAWHQSPVGTIPDNDDILSKWSRVSKAKWMKIRDSVLAAFYLEGDRWRNKRMEDEWAKLLAKKAERSKAGSKGMKTRWHSDNSAINLQSSCYENSITNDNSSSSSSSSIDNTITHTPREGEQASDSRESSARSEALGFSPDPDPRLDNPPPNLAKPSHPMRQIAKNGVWRRFRAKDDPNLASFSRRVYAQISASHRSDCQIG